MLHNCRKTGWIHRRLAAQTGRQRQSRARSGRDTQPHQHVIDSHSVVFQRNDRRDTAATHHRITRRLLRQRTQRFHQQHIPVCHPFTVIGGTHPDRSRPLRSLLTLTQNRHIHRITQRGRTGNSRTHRGFRLHRKLPRPRHIPQHCHRWLRRHRRPLPWQPRRQPQQRAHQKHQSPPIHGCPLKLASRRFSMTTGRHSRYGHHDLRQIRQKLPNERWVHSAVSE